MSADAEAEAAVERADVALAALEGLEGPARSTAESAMAALVAVYGEALARVMDTLARHEPALAATLVGDRLIDHVLRLHGLHPDAVDERIERGLAELRSHLVGPTTVELVGIDGGTARLRLDDVDDGGPSAESIAEAVEYAVLTAAPELEAVTVDGAETGPRPVMIPVEAIGRRPATAATP